MGALPARGALCFFCPLPFPPVREARLRAGMWGWWPARAPGERALPGGEARDEAAVGRLLARRRAGLEGRRREEAPGLQRTRLGTGEACTVPTGGVPASLPALGASRPRLLVLCPRVNLLAFGGRDPQNGYPAGRGCRPPSRRLPAGLASSGAIRPHVQERNRAPHSVRARPPAPPPQGDGPQTAPLTRDLRSGPRSACNFLPGGAQSLVCSSVQGGGWSWWKKEKKGKWLRCPRPTSRRPGALLGSCQQRWSLSAWPILPRLDLQGVAACRLVGRLDGSQLNGPPAVGAH
ncbi:PREDICTED: uncharacterized protein LOC107181871 isoform X2 [Myotis davidii]|uniref:uncharacterized protein LOC107181871 isoform X2 n=1 Tax=Myotis davidii TaxID=225400 RepID=UPI000767096C|nr:PREDICTED: uncharacterized protein LOC107181871 isoform X2 [Myotis davidii]